jgi:hypothetical protein
MRARSGATRVCDTPLSWNSDTLTYAYNTGSLEFDGAVPSTGATANISTPIVTYLSLSESFRALGECPCFFAVWRWQLSRTRSWRREARLPVRTPGFVLAVFREFEGRAGAAGPGVPKMAPENINWR